MITAPVASAMCRDAAARIREIVSALRDDMALNDYWACDHPEASEDEIYAVGVVDGLGGEAGDFAASWTPSAALAVADLLDRAAVDLDALPAGAEIPPLLSLAARLAQSFGGAA